MKINFERLEKLGFTQSLLSFLKQHQSETQLVDTWAINAQDIISSHPNKADVLKTQFLNYKLL